MPQPSDSSYAAVTRLRRPFGNGRPLGVSERWDDLQDDEIVVDVTTVLPLEEDDEDASPAGNSTAVANNLLDRRRREENWSDLGLDRMIVENTTQSTVAPHLPTSGPDNTSTTSSPSPS